MAKLDEPKSFPRGDDHQADADRYAHNGPEFAGQVDAYARKTPTLGAGGPHNRPARGHESET